MAAETLSASLEDYLEAIYQIVLKKQAARASDIADHLQVHRSSVTNALRGLKERGFVNYAPYDLITLTEQGRILGADIRHRHEVLNDFFLKVLGIEGDLADETACQMEHNISKEVLERFVQFIDYVDNCPRAGSTWIEGFGYYCKNGCTEDDCARCTEECLAGILSGSPQQHIRSSGRKTAQA